MEITEHILIRIIKSDTKAFYQSERDETAMPAGLYKPRRHSLLSPVNVIVSLGIDLSAVAVSIDTLPS
jgi:hypothetical protein